MFTIRILWCYSFDPSTGKLLPDVSLRLGYPIHQRDFHVPVLYPSLLEESGPSWAVDHLSAAISGTCVWLSFTHRPYKRREAKFQHELQHIPSSIVTAVR